MKLINLIDRYKLAPEHRYPIQLNQIYKASKYLINNAEKYCVDTSRIAIMGDNTGRMMIIFFLLNRKLSYLNFLFTGGNMAVATVHKLRKEGVNLKLQCLINAPLQFFDFTLPSYQQNAPANHLNLLTHEGMSRLIHEYLGLNIPKTCLANNSHTSEIMKKTIANNYLSWNFLPEKYRNQYKPINENVEKALTDENSVLFNKDVSPLLESDDTLKLCPTTYVMSCEYDIFRDDGLIYAARLKNLGVNSVVKHYDTGYHGAFSFYQSDNFAFPRKLFADLVEFIVKNI